MSITKKMLYKNWILLLLVLLIGFVAIGAIIIYTGTVLTNKTIESFYVYMLEKEKDGIKTEVENRLDEILFEKQDLVEKVKEKLKQQVETMETIIQNTFNHTLDEDAFRQIPPFVHQNKKSNAFILKEDGAFINRPTDLMLFSDDVLNNITTTQQLLKRPGIENGLLLHYQASEKATGSNFTGYLYIKYLPEYKWFIGAGYTQETLNEDLKALIINRLQSYYENKPNYIFLNQYDGTALVAVRESYIGKNVFEIEGVDANALSKAIMSIIDHEGSGFIAYSFINKNNDVPSEKISYIYDLEEWDAYIGMGFYLDTLKSDIQTFNDLYLRYFYNESFLTIVALTILSLIVSALFQRGAYLQKKYIEQDDVIFERLFELSGQSIAVVSSLGELIHQNKRCLDLFDQKLEIYLVNGNVSLPSVTTDIYELNINHQKRYLRYLCEQMLFRGELSTIYIFEDISTLYLQNSQLEQIALLDALTQLPNRYAMERDYALIASGTGQLVIGILDIDFFKAVNDDYGHPVGDEVLKLLASVVTHRLRQSDKVYRYGGEEFVIILTHITLEKAQNVVEEINFSFKNATLKQFGFEKTFSCGLVQINNHHHYDINKAITEADILLYQAKNLGRNRVEISIVNEEKKT